MKGRKMEVIMKKSLFIPLLMMIFVFTGCMPYNEDIYAKNKAYLKYSIGNFNVNKERAHQYSSALPVRIDYNEWTLNYTDSNDQFHTIMFDNKNNSSLLKALYNKVELFLDFAASDLLSDMKKFYLTIWEDKNISFNLAISMDFSKQNNKQIMDPKTGFRLKDISLDEINAFWVYQIELTVFYQNSVDRLNQGDMYYISPEKLDELKPIVIQVMQKATEYFNNDSVSALLIINPLPNGQPVNVSGEALAASYTLRFDKDTNSFTWIKTKNIH